MSITSHTVSTRYLLSAAFIYLFAFAISAHAHEGEDHGGVPASVEGDAEVEVSDDFASGKSEVRFFVKDKSGKRKELQLPTGMSAPKIVTGDKIRVKGHIHSNRADAILLDEPVAALAGSTSSTTGATAAAISGTRTALAIVTDFADSNVSCSDSTVASTLFAPSPALSVDTYLDETSKGLAGLTGNVVRVKISANVGSTCDYNAWASAANTEAAKQISLSGFQHKIYVLPANTPCGWAGLGTIGGGSTWVKTCSTGRVYAHELGHNFTMWHAGQNGGGEYGDNTDVMGSTYAPVNAPHSIQMGWTPSTNVLKVTQDGTYRLTSLETAPSAAITPQVITLVKEDTGETYYLSLRTPSGLFGSQISGSNRLSVHRWGKENHTRIHGTFGIDQPFTDTANGLTVTPITLNGDTMDVRIDVTAICRPSAPTITVSNPGGTVAIGSAGTASVSIRNNDSAYCSPSTFALSSAISQAGVTSSTSVPSVTVAPGSTGSFSVVMQSTTATVAGTYTGTVTGSDASLSRSVSGNLSITIGTAPIRGKGRKNR